VNVYINVLHLAGFPGRATITYLRIETDFSGTGMMLTSLLEEGAIAGKSLVEVRCRFAAHGIVAEFAKDRGGFRLGSYDGKNCTESQNLLPQIHVLAPLSKTSKKFSF